ncbi:RNA polymerase factor sigma-54 [Thermovenabulum sp.]|uniref:RNA polymerase factor sigma-54 n=1 Tax=Thermovenabulum sp. TaxID=3100335 RepID=UPI003C7AAFB5
MQVNFSLNLTQTQKLLMTPELKQAITILQLSSLELTEYIENELVENPILEIEDEEYEDPEEISVTGEEDYNIEWQEYLEQCADADFIRMPKEEKEEKSFENFVSLAPTLQEYLLNQLFLMKIDKRSFKIGEFLIGNIDNRGYLTLGVREAAEILKVRESEVERVLKIVQSFDPPGVGARDLKECLIIQLEQKGILDDLLRKIIEEHLEDLAQAKYSRIAERLNISLSKVQELKDIILTLDPKPGRNFASGNETQYIIPDASVRKINDEYIILMNDTVTPKLSINPYYRSLLNSEDKDPGALKFLAKRFESALWLIKSIEQRRMTLYKVIKAIIDVQKEFLDHGIAYLKPLTLKQIADKVGVHESTVSRAINGKYIQTPRGIFELKFFFSNGLEGSDGSAISAETIKKMIKEMINAENPYNPISDQKIADELKEKGINISRRTVAKYREEIGIPCSAKRKRLA